MSSGPIPRAPTTLLLQRKGAPPSLAHELAARTAAGRWDGEGKPVKEADEVEEEEDETAALREALGEAKARARARRAGHLGTRGVLAGWAAALSDQPDVILLRVWASFRRKQVSKLLHNAHAAAWTALTLHLLALLVAVWATEGSALRAPDGPLAAGVGCTAFLAALGSAWLKRSLKSALPAPSALSSASWGGRGRSTAPTLWLATVVASHGVWLRAALTLGLPPAFAAVVLCVSATSLLLDLGMLRQCVVEWDPSASPREGGVRSGLTALPGRFTGTGWASTLDRTVSTLCMVAGVCNAACPTLHPYAPPTPSELALGDESFAATLRGIAMVEHAEALQECRGFTHVWLQPCVALLLLTLAGSTVQRGWEWLLSLRSSKGGGGAASRVWLHLSPLLPVVLPFAAAVVMSVVGLPPSPGSPAPPVWGAYGHDMPGALYGGCTVEQAPGGRGAASHHATLLVLASTVCAAWCAILLGDVCVLWGVGVGGGSPPRLAAALPHLPPAATGVLLTALLIIGGAAVVLGACTPLVGASILPPLPGFGIFFLVMAASRHTGSAWATVADMEEEREGENRKGE